MDAEKTCRWHDCPLDGDGRCNALDSPPAASPPVFIDVPEQTPEERFRLLSLGLYYSRNGGD